MSAKTYSDLNGVTVASFAIDDATLDASGLTAARTFVLPDAGGTIALIDDVNNILGNDPYYNNVSLLLPMEGENNSTVFTDYSWSPKNITRSGDTKILTAQSKWGNGSGYFDGTGDYLTAPISAIPSSGDFTVELWVYVANYSTLQYVLSQMDFSGTAVDGRFSLQITQTTGLFRLFIGAASGNLDLQTSGAVPTGQWAHLAVTRASNIFRLFINGVLRATSASYATAIASELTRVGVYISGSNFTGYVQDLRITSGNARYTDNFTSPERLLLSIQVQLQLNGKQPNTTSLTEIGAALVDADEIPVYDASATGNRKSLLSRIWTYISGKLTATANTFTANQIISVADNTNAALRITQTGTGNCLVVEDSANPDASPFVIDASGNVGIGLGVASFPLHIVHQGTSSVANNIVVVELNAATTPGMVIRRSNGTNDSKTAVVSGSGLFSLRANGYDGANYINGASIDYIVDAAPALDSMPGRLVFSTTANGSAIPTERLRINSSGNVGIGTTTISARTHIVATTEQLRLGYDATKYASFTTQSDGALALGINGTERVRVKATGQVRFLPLSSAPSGAESGDVYYNSTDNKLYCHNGTTWNALF
jgi:hypothetical protein